MIYQNFGLLFLITGDFDGSPVIIRYLLNPEEDKQLRPDSKKFKVSDILKDTVMKLQQATGKQFYVYHDACRVSWCFK